MFLPFYKNKVKFQINEKIYTTIKWNVFKEIYKIIGVHWHKDTIMNQLHIHALYICVCVIFKAQINYLWFLEEFKVSEILHVTILILYVLSLLGKIIYTLPSILKYFFVGLACVTWIVTSVVWWKWGRATTCLWFMPFNWDSRIHFVLLLSKLCILIIE